MHCPECGAPLACNPVQKFRRVYQYFSCLNGTCAIKWRLYGNLVRMKVKVGTDLPPSSIPS